MIIGLARMTLRLPACHSLKEKRAALNTIKARLTQTFNVSVAEVDQQDVWQKAVLAVAHVGVSRPVVDSVLARAVDLVEGYHATQLLDPSTRTPPMGGGPCSGCRPKGVKKGTSGMPEGAPL